MPRLLAIGGVEVSGLDLRWRKSDLYMQNRTRKRTAAPAGMLSALKKSIC